jgi:hypothetical protein
MYFRPNDPNFFTIWNWNHRYFFLRPIYTLLNQGEMRLAHDSWGSALGPMMYLSKRRIVFLAIYAGPNKTYLVRSVILYVCFGVEQNKFVAPLVVIFVHQQTDLRSFETWQPSGWINIHMNFHVIMKKNSRLLWGTYQYNS